MKMQYEIIKIYTVSSENNTNFCFVAQVLEKLTKPEQKFQ